MASGVVWFSCVRLADEGLPNGEGPKPGQIGVAVPLACLLAVRWPGLRSLVRLIEARGLANRSEGLGLPGPVDRSEGFGTVGPV